MIRFRFEDNIIEGLLKTSWWDLPLEIISQNAELFAKEPNLEVINKMLLLN